MLHHCQEFYAFGSINRQCVLQTLGFLGVSGVLGPVVRLVSTLELAFVILLTIMYCCGLNFSEVP